MGIDLTPGGPGVTPNDPLDADTGPNDYQNFPVITSARVTGDTVKILGTFDSAASKTYRLEFFGNDALDPSNYGEGKTFLGSTDVTTNASGHADLDVSFPALAGALRVTSTATDPAGNTPEFSTSVGQLLNLSTRLGILGGDKNGIGGFIVTGPDPKRVIVRGIGPSLSESTAHWAIPRWNFMRATAPPSPPTTTGNRITKPRSKRPGFSRRTISNRQLSPPCRLMARLTPPFCRARTEQQGSD